ncbi:MAG TPA: ParB N-terminal domain-containing protein [Candidatus Dormibacteraeota bacterium]|jgi:ParB-like chromosome segregation protein Spo0J|nr:ParB N-terminal domain-containing protein [Candidatus Dormibacteraeota bacterium]
MSERRFKDQITDVLAESLPDHNTGSLERWLAPTTESRVDQIPVEIIRDRAWRADVDVTEPAFRALRASIRASGVLQPLLLRPHPEGGFEVVSGARRLRAARDTAQSTVPAVVRELNDVQALVGGSWDAVLRAGLTSSEARDLVAKLAGAGMGEGEAEALVATAPARADAVDVAVAAVVADEVEAAVIADAEPVADAQVVADVEPAAETEPAADLAAIVDVVDESPDVVADVVDEALVDVADSEPVADAQGVADVEPAGETEPAADLAAVVDVVDESPSVVADVVEEAPVDVADVEASVADAELLDLADVETPDETDTAPLSASDVEAIEVSQAVLPEAVDDAAPEAAAVDETSDLDFDEDVFGWPASEEPMTATAPTSPPTPLPVDPMQFPIAPPSPENGTDTVAAEAVLTETSPAPVETPSENGSGEAAEVALMLPDAPPADIEAAAAAEVEPAAAEPTPEAADVEPVVVVSAEAVTTDSTSSPHVIPINLPDPAIAFPADDEADLAGSMPVAAPVAAQPEPGSRLVSPPAADTEARPAASRPSVTVPGVLRRGPLFYAVFGIGLAVGAIVFILVSVSEGVGGTTSIIGAVVVAVLGFVTAMVSLAQPRQRR